MPSQLSVCLFPIHWPGEKKNSHEPFVGKNVFLQFVYLKRYTIIRFKKISN